MLMVVWYGVAMKYKHFNNNPLKKNAGDCVIRAISNALGKSWNDIYIGLCVKGYAMADMPNSNAVWGEYLLEHGFHRYIIPNTCPNCYTVADFAADNTVGRYIVATGTHAICVKNGVVYDSWNSTNEVPIYYFAEVDR